MIVTGRSGFHGYCCAAACVAAPSATAAVSAVHSLCIDPSPDPWYLTSYFAESVACRDVKSSRPRTDGETTAGYLGRCSSGGRRVTVWRPRLKTWSGGASSATTPAGAGGLGAERTAR